MSEARESLEERARRAMIQHALMRWESAGVLAGSFLLSFLLTVFDANILGMPNATWIGIGAVAYMALAWSSFTDEKIGHEVVESLLRADFDPGKLQSERLQTFIDEALDYRSRITDLINKRPDSALKVQLESMANQFDEWVEEIYMMAEKLDQYEIQRDHLKQSYFQADRQTTGYKARLAKVRDKKMKADLMRNIQNNQRQMETIESLETTMERARLRLEDTLTAMATIYPQTLLLGAKDIDNSRYKRLQAEISDEVEELGDVLYAMDEVYASSTI